MSQASAAAAPPSAAKTITELTIRGLILGVLITLVFTAANVYLGLKVGLTFATSIPAAVISMAVLSAFKDSSILENNIVQTVASAAGTLSAIIFVLPGLVIVGWGVGLCSVLDRVRRLRHRRRARRVVHYSAAPRDGDDLRPALSRRPRCRRSARGRSARTRSNRRGHRIARRLDRRHLRLDRLAGPGCVHGDAHRRRRGHAVFLAEQVRPELGYRLRYGFLAGASGRGLPGGPVGRHGHVVRPRHCLGRGGTGSDYADARRGGGVHRRPRRRYLAPSGALHRRGD